MRITTKDLVIGGAIGIGAWLISQDDAEGLERPPVPPAVVQTQGEVVTAALVELDGRVSNREAAETKLDQAATLGAATLNAVEAPKAPTE